MEPEILVISQKKNTDCEGGHESAVAINIV